MYERCCYWSETKTLEEMCLLTTIVFENNGISKIKAISFTQDEKLNQKYRSFSSLKLLRRIHISVHYGWDVSEDGSKLFCREAYTSADALLRHLDGAGPIVDEMLKECGMSVAQFEVVCNKGDVDKLKGPCSVFDANYRVCYDGFDNGYEVSKRQ